MRYLILALALVSNSLRADPLVGLPPTPQLTREGYQLILDFEVGGGRPYYERFLKRPTWPGGDSGATVGVGYDLGYNYADVIRTDWRKLPDRERLTAAAGIKRAPARVWVSRLHDILIEWSLAEGVFNEVTLSRFWQLTRRTFPGFDELHPNAQAALTSIVFNRGNSTAGPTRIEMRELVRLVPKRDYRGMAAQVRAMKRLWVGKGMQGLLNRREAEARLLESCK